MEVGREREAGTDPALLTWRGWTAVRQLLVGISTVY